MVDFLIKRHVPANARPTTMEITVKVRVFAALILCTSALTTSIHLLKDKCEDTYEYCDPAYWPNTDDCVDPYWKNTCRKICGNCGKIFHHKT